MRLAGVGPGDEVITSPYSFVASANCAIYEGATPVFADIDPRTYNLDPAAVEAAITPRTKAIVAVDIFGYPAEYDELLALCEQSRHRADRGLLRGARRAVQGQAARLARPSGGLGVLPEQADDDRRGRRGHDRHRRSEHELLVSLRNQGRLETSSWLQHGRLGYNYRLDDVSAALGIGQLEKLDRILAARSRVAESYDELLRGRRRRDAARGRRRPRPLVVRLRREAAREASTATRVMARLSAHGIATAPYLPSIHLQSYMRERYGFAEGMLPVSEDCSARTMALPFHARLERADQERVVEALRTALVEHNPAMADAPRMVFLGFGKYVRSDRIYALEPLPRRRARLRRAHAGLGRGHPRAGGRVAHRARDPRRHGRAAQPLATVAAGREPLLT